MSDSAPGERLGSTSAPGEYYSRYALGRAHAEKTHSGHHTHQYTDMTHTYQVSSATGCAEACVCVRAYACMEGSVLVQC